jgi:predicted nucleotidyltransferase
MEQTIIQMLNHIKKEHDVKIILASESGSRAWGFPSSDSDYDVRFIYAHQTDWYLSIGNKKDVIELPVDKVLDVNGWDLKKALQLMHMKNCCLCPNRPSCRKPHAGITCQWHAKALRG